MRTLIILSMLVIANIAYAVSQAEFATAINVAGRQRMLSQKMAKESLLVHLKINPDKNAAELKKTTALFDASLKSLHKGNSAEGIPAPPSPAITKQLNSVNNLWKQYRTAIQKGHIQNISKQNLPVLKEMNKAVKMFEVESAKAGIKGAGKVINIAGRQRMLTQKMAKEIFLIAAKIDETKNLASLKATKNLFVRSLDALQNGSEKMRIKKSSDEKINAQLNTVSNLWAKYQSFVDKVISTKKTDADLLKNVEAINPQVLKAMDDAVKMFETASK